MHLVEVKKKKAYFLKEVRRALGLENVEVHAVSWEDLEAEADLAVAKATGKLESLLRALPHLLKPRGELLLFSATKEKEPTPLRVVQLDNPLRCSGTYLLFYRVGHPRG